MKSMPGKMEQQMKHESEKKGKLQKCINALKEEYRAKQKN